MDYHTSKALGSSQNDTHAHVRNTANYHPNIWGTRFIDYIGDSQELRAENEKQVKELKTKVRIMLVAAASDPSKQLKLIDLLQRLGVSYHFEKEIEDTLEHIYSMQYIINGDAISLDIVALGFRILREHGYFVPCDVFNMFKSKIGSFLEHLISDVEGLLSLYEASHLRVTGEDILDEALDFSTCHLKSLAAKSGNPLAGQITRSLKRPLRRSIPRVEARHNILVYQENPLHDKTILRLAQIDFNLLQSLHKKELCEFSLWWKDLDFAKKLPYARDRHVECYFWIMSIYYEPQYALGRKILTKVIAMAAVLDDTYDAYGTVDELKLFTEAIKRWDINCKVELPDYMQIFYQALIDVFEEIEYAVKENGTLHGVHYVKQAIKDLAEGYLIEAIWCEQNFVPTMEDYMKVALLTTGYIMLIAASFLGMGLIATKEAFDWEYSNPKIVRASTIICRLMDDIVSNEFEQERKHVAPAIECYVKEHGVSIEQGIREFQIQVENAWKDVNESFLRPAAVPFPLLTRILNFCRVIDILYAEHDGFTHVGEVTKDAVTSMFIDPVPM